MPTKPINTLLRSKVLVAILVAVLFVLGVVQVLQGTIDTAAYLKQVQQLVREQTGRELTVRGQVAVSLLPSPNIYFPGVELRDSETNAETPVLSIDMVQIGVSMGSIFSGQPIITDITLEKPSLKLTRTQDGVMHWAWLNSGLLQMIGNPAAPQPVAFRVSDGSVTYHNDAIGAVTEIHDISAAGATGSALGINGSLAVVGHTLEFDAQTIPGGQASVDGTLPAVIHIVADSKDTLKLEGSVNLTSQEPQINGKIVFAMEDVLAWTEDKQDDAPRQAIYETDVTEKTAPDKAAEKPKLPVSFSGEWKQSGSSVEINIAQFQSTKSSGKGALKVTWQGVTPEANAQLEFSELDYGFWGLLTNRWLFTKQAKNYQDSSSASQNPLAVDATIALALTADHMTFGEQALEKVKLSATLDKGSITINQIDVKLPGETSLTLFGVISQSATKELRFEGNMETSGNSLRGLLTMFDTSALELPEAELGHFYVRSNIYIAPNQMRLSEADTKINDLRLNGGLVIYYDAAPRLEANIKLKDIDFDYFRNAWRKKQKEKDEKNFFLRFDREQNFNWLKKLKAVIDFRVKVEGFNFLERHGDDASFRIFAQEGELGVYNMIFKYPDDTLEASFSLNAKQEQPVLNLLLNAKALDTAYFKTKEEVPKVEGKNKPASSQRWSEELINMAWMEGLSGAFDISLGSLTHGDQTVSDLKVRAKLEDNLLALQNCNFSCWQGKCTLGGSVYGGKVPGISVTYTIYNADAQDLLKSIFGRDNISGRTSVSGTLATSGVNMLSWVSQAEGEIMFSGRGINVADFNIGGVENAVAVARTAADVLANVNLALFKGNTELSADGSVNLKAGVLRSPGVTIKTGSVVGSLSGEIRLVPWTTELSSLYQFPMITSETTPTLTVQIIGPVDKLETHVDTSSLEAYVAKRITGTSGK